MLESPEDEDAREVREELEHIYFEVQRLEALSYRNWKEEDQLRIYKGIIEQNKKC